MAEIFMTDETESNAQAKGWNNAPTQMVLLDAAQTKQLLPSYIGKEDDVYGAALNRQRSGYVRTEDIGRVFMAIMAKKGHQVWTNLELLGLTVQDDFQVIATTKPSSHEWIVEDQIKTRRSLGDADQRYDDPFHGLILCTGAAPEFINKFDKDTKYQLVAGFGNIVVGPPNTVSEAESRIGVVLEEYHMYLRSTKDRRLAVGGGMWIAPPTAESAYVRSLPYKQPIHTYGEIWGFTGDMYMKQARIGEWLVAHNETLRQGGARPLCHLGNFPLIKVHPFGPVVINTGMGVNGFIMSWKAGQIASDLLLTQQDLLQVPDSKTSLLEGGGGTPWSQAAWSWIGAPVDVSMREPLSLYRVITQGLNVYRSEDGNDILGRLDVNTMVYGSYINGNCLEIDTVVFGTGTESGWEKGFEYDSGSGWIRDPGSIRLAVYRIEYGTFLYDSDKATGSIVSEAIPGHVYMAIESGDPGYGGTNKTKGAWLAVKRTHSLHADKDWYIKLMDEPDSRGPPAKPCYGPECVELL